MAKRTPKKIIQVPIEDELLMRIGGRHPPLDFRLRDDVGGVDDGGSGGGSQRAPPVVTMNLRRSVITPPPHIATS
jgi:hypothetical protein